MKGLAILAIIGLASAQAVAPSPIAVQGAPVDPNALNSSAAIDPALDPNAAASASLSGLDVGGLNLGSIDLSNQADVLNAIELMMSALCLNNLVQEAQLEQLGQVAELEMLFELAQLMQLQQVGLLNLVQIQGLFSGNSLFSNVFNVGVLKRSIEDKKRELRQSKTHRGWTKVKRQSCQNGQIVDPNAVGAAPPAAVSVDPAVAASAAAIAPPAAAATVAAAPAAAAATVAAAPAAAAAPVAAPAAAPASSADEPLSDFTR